MEERPKMKGAALRPTMMRAPSLARYEGRVFDILGRDVSDAKRRLASGVCFLRREEDNSTAKVVLQK